MKNFNKSVKCMNILLDTLESTVPVYDGIYFSRKTGKLFEATKKWNKVHVKYCDGSEGMKIAPAIFRIQYEVFELYELLIKYKGKK